MTLSARMTKARTQYPRLCRAKKARTDADSLRVNFWIADKASMPPSRFRRRDVSSENSLLQALGAAFLLRDFVVFALGTGGALAAAARSISSFASLNARNFAVFASVA